MRVHFLWGGVFPYAAHGGRGGAGGGAARRPASFRGRVGTGGGGQRRRCRRGGRFLSRGVVRDGNLRHFRAV